MEESPNQMRELREITDQLVQTIQSHPEIFQQIHEYLLNLLNDLKSMKTNQLFLPVQPVCFETSRSMQLISQLYGDNFTTLQLVQLCINFASQINVKLERDTLRQKENMINWLDLNYDALKSYLCQIQAQ